MKQNVEGTVVQGLGDSKGLPLRAYSVQSASESAPDCPDLGENPLLLFTLAYSELIEAIASVPPSVSFRNEVVDTKGKAHILKASTCRIDRHIHFRAVWQPPFGIRTQLALRDLTEACTRRFGGCHFAVAKESERLDIFTQLQAGALPPARLDDYALPNGYLQFYL